MRGIVIAAGVCAQMVGWWFVSFKGREVWHVLPFLLAAMGVGALLLLPDAATRVVVGVAVRWEPLARQVRDAYRPTGEERFARSLVLSLLLSVPGEELFYRGLVQRTAAGTWLGLGGGALLTWLLYIIANAPSRSLPIIAGAVVGGFVWCALAWWSGGLVAPLASHMVWTGLMLGVPPRVGRLVAEPA
jgi:membrane protease YdiL (CAAX protease family)